MKKIPSGIGTTLPKDVVEKIDRLIDISARSNSNAAATSALVIVLLDIADSLREMNGYVPDSSWKPSGVEIADEQ